MTIGEAILTLNANVVVACGRAGFDSATVRMIEDALDTIEDALEAQDAVEPYMDYDGQDVWRCGKCGNSLMHPSYHEPDEDVKNHIRYCSHCGKAVKWE